MVQAYTIGNFCVNELWLIRKEVACDDGMVDVLRSLSCSSKSFSRKQKLPSLISPSFLQGQIPQFSQAKNQNTRIKLLSVQLCIHYEHIKKEKDPLPGAYQSERKAPCKSCYATLQAC